MPRACDTGAHTLRFENDLREREREREKIKEEEEENGDVGSSALMSNIKKERGLPFGNE